MLKTQVLAVIVAGLTIATGSLAQTTLRLEPVAPATAALVINESPYHRSSTISEITVAIAFDRNRIFPSGVSFPDTARTHWDWHFNMESLDTVEPGLIVLRLVGRAPDTATGPTLTPDSALAVITFNPAHDSLRYARLDFFWADCDDNLLKVDTAACAVAAAVYDPDNIDITDFTDSLPTAHGLCDSCLPWLSGNGNTVERSLTFHSLRLPLDLTTSVDPVDQPQLPASPILHQNYPNPFNAGTTISFDLADSYPWRLDIYNTQGRTVRVFSGDADIPGPVSLFWDGRDQSGRPLASGVYPYKLTTPLYELTRKLVYLK